MSPETKVPQVNEPSVPVRKISRATVRKNKGWFKDIAPIKKATSRHTLKRDYGRRFTHDDLDGEYPTDYGATVRDYTAASKIRAVPEDILTHTPGDIQPRAITYDDLESVSNDDDAIDIDDIDIDLKKADSTDDDEFFDAEEEPAGTEPQMTEGRSRSQINAALKLMRDIGMIRDAVYEDFERIMRMSSADRRAEASNASKYIVNRMERIKELVGFNNEDFSSRTHEFEIYNQAFDIAKDTIDRLNDIRNGTDTRAKTGSATQGWGWPFSGGRRRCRTRRRRRRYHGGVPPLDISQDDKYEESPYYNSARYYNRNVTMREGERRTYPELVDAYNRSYWNSAKSSFAEELLDKSTGSPEVEESPDTQDYSDYHEHLEKKIQKKGDRATRKAELAARSGPYSTGDLYAEHTLADIDNTRKPAAKYFEPFRNRMHFIKPHSVSSKFGGRKSRRSRCRSRTRHSIRRS